MFPGLSPSALPIGLLSMGLLSLAAVVDAISRVQTRVVAAASLNPGETSAGIPERFPLNCLDN